MSEYVFHAVAYEDIPIMDDSFNIAVQRSIYKSCKMADLAVN